MILDRRKFLAITSAALACLGMPSAAKGISACGPARFRITVVRRECFSELQGRYLADPDCGACSSFATGQTFTAATGRCPEGFCPRAWRVIEAYIADADAPGCSAGLSRRETLVCCGSGTNPVIFKIEPMI